MMVLSLMRVNYTLKSLKTQVFSEKPKSFLGFGTPSNLLADPKGTQYTHRHRA